MRSMLASAMVVTTLLAGCGNDAAQADIRRFCELVEQYNKGGFQPPPDDAPEEEHVAALRAYLSLPETEAILGELGEVAPEEVAPHVATMREMADALVRDGASPFDNPEVERANRGIIDFTGEHCAADAAG